MNKIKNKKGFTLIELLVVVAIIGLLSSVVLASLNNARTKARDAKRLSDIKQLVTAIEMYYNDNSIYPVCAGGGNVEVCSTTGYQSDLATLQVVPTYISSISKDPANVDGQYGYYYARGYKLNSSNSIVYTGSNQNYLVATRLENSPNLTFNAWNNSRLNVLKGQ